MAVNETFCLRFNEFEGVIKSCWQELQRENDLCDILKFDKKFLRCKLATLKADKFIVMKLKIETRENGKAVKSTTESL